MGHKFNLQGNTMYNTKTGSAQVFEEGKKEHYAVLVKAGHCGKGYYIPQIIGITASSQALAVEIAKQMARIKSSRASAVIDVIKISEVEKNFISYINACDKYLHITHNSKETCTNVLDRRIAMEEAVDFKNSGDRNKIQACDVKTADKYSNVHVLQRYLAPSYYGDKLIYPKSINFRLVLDEFFYYATLQLGMFKKKGSSPIFLLSNIWR